MPPMMPPTRLSHAERAERRREIAAFVKGGATAAEAIDRFRMTKESVVKACWEAGIRIPKNKLSANHTVFRVLAALFKGGETYEATGARLGCTRQYIQNVNRAAIDAGIPLRMRRKVKS